MPTVSRVLDRRSDVAPHTPERVEQLLREHGHQRRGPRADGRAWLIDLVFNDLDSPWAVEVIPRRRGGRPRGRCGDRRVGHPPAPQLGPAVAGEPAGLLAVRTVLRLLNGEHLESAKVELATAVVVRDSTAPPGSAEHRSA